ncbi:MAG: cell division protein FtsL [Ignavibacteria bacterium]|nr:cell division protein FtsL [Ignavibacteria bacterium]
MNSEYSKKSGKISRKASVFYYLISFLILAVTVGFYINNTIEVDKLIKKNKELKEKLLSINQDNMHYKVEIEKLSSYERISRIAAEKFNMIKNDSAIDKRDITIPVEENKMGNKEN